MSLDNCIQFASCADHDHCAVRHYRWHKKFGGLRIDQAKRLKKLEKVGHEHVGGPPMGDRDHVEPAAARMWHDVAIEQHDRDARVAQHVGTCWLPEAIEAGTLAWPQTSA